MCQFRVGVRSDITLNYESISCFIEYYLKLMIKDQKYFTKTSTVSKIVTESYYYH